MRPDVNLLHLSHIGGAVIALAAEDKDRMTSDRQTPTLPDAVPLRRLRRLGVLAPLAFLALIEVVRFWLGLSARASIQTYIGLLLVIGAATVAFAWAIFAVVDRVQERLALRNQELLALDAAGLAIVRDLDLHTVLQGVVDQARELARARYGALQYRSSGDDTAAFLTSGITPEQRAALGPPPRGHGLLGVVLANGENLRLADLTRDPRSVGFPPGHPAMRSLLAVPIPAAKGVLGNLYVVEKADGLTFTAEDERTLERFATHAALAITNARLHRERQALATTEERERIAREMHDSTAQVLGYVSTKSQAVGLLIASGQTDRALAQIEQLGETARSAYADVREGILGLRTSVSADRAFIDSLGDYLTRWQEQSGVPAELVLEMGDHHRLSLSPIAEVQLIRIIQEALANVRKHANASHVKVRLAERDGRIDASVEDDGQGFSPDELGRSPVPRFGLSTMRERAEAIGGTFTVTASPGSGTRVAVRIPMDRPSSRTGE